MHVRACVCVCVCVCVGANLTNEQWNDKGLALPVICYFITDRLERMDWPFVSSYYPAS